MAVSNDTKRRAVTIEAKPFAFAHDDCAARFAEQLEQALRSPSGTTRDAAIGAGLRLAAERPSLLERIARAKYAEGDPETAGMLLEPALEHSACARLLLSAARLCCGRWCDAAADLARWSTAHDCPTEARLLHALLCMEHDDPASARIALMRNLRRGEDARSLALLLLLSIDVFETAAEPPALDERRCWAARLQRALMKSPHPTELEHLLDSLGWPSAVAEVAQVEPCNSDDLDHLVLELIAAEEVIPVLVDVHEASVDRSEAMLLREGIASALPELRDQRAALASLARLSLAIGDRRSARHWIRLGQFEFGQHGVFGRLAQRLEEPTLRLHPAEPVAQEISEIGEISPASDNANERRAA